MSLFDSLRRMFGKKPTSRGRIHPAIEGMIRRNPRATAKTFGKNPVQKIRNTPVGKSFLQHIAEEVEAFEQSRDRRQENELGRLQNDPEFRFLVKGEHLSTPQSTYMVSCWYHMVDQELYVAHADGSIYGYRSVTPEMARSLYRAGSKGTWMWDNIRIRGAGVYAHRVPYWIVKNPLPEFSNGRGYRLWATNVQTAMERDVEIQRLGQFQQVQRQVGGQLFSTLTSKFARKTPVENTGRRMKIGPTP